MIPKRLVSSFGTASMPTILHRYLSNSLTIWLRTESAAATGNRHFLIDGMEFLTFSRSRFDLLGSPINIFKTDNIVLAQIVTYLNFYQLNRFHAGIA